MGPLMIVVIGAALFFVIVAVGAYFAFRKSRRVQGANPVHPDTEREDLDHRLAVGEMPSFQHEELREHVRPTEDGFVDGPPADIHTEGGGKETRA